MDLGEIEWGGVDWIFCLRIGTSGGSGLSGYIKYWEILE
jgi:hypothetical protein